MRLPTLNLGQRIVLVVAFAPALRLIASYYTGIGREGGVAIVGVFAWSASRLVVWLALIALWAAGSAWLLRDRPDPSEE